MTPSLSHLRIHERAALPWSSTLQTNHVRRGENQPFYEPDLFPGNLRHPAIYENGHFYQQIGLCWKQLFTFILTLTTSAKPQRCNIIINCIKLHGALGHHLPSLCYTGAAASAFLSPFLFLVFSLSPVLRLVFRQPETFPEWRGGKGISGLSMGESW